MIARIWRGWAPLATADDYQRHYETEVSGQLRAVSGCPFTGGLLCVLPLLVSRERSSLTWVAVLE
jgi:hypothetical protein